MITYASTWNWIFNLNTLLNVFWAGGWLLPCQTTNGCFRNYVHSTPLASKVHCSINGLENSSSPQYSKVQHLFGIAVGLFSAGVGLFLAGVGLFSATVGLRKSPPPTKKSPTPIEKSPPLAKKVLLWSKKVLLEKSPPPTNKVLLQWEKSPVAHTRNILRSSEYIFTHVLLDFGIFWKPGWFGRLPISLLLAASRVPTAPPELNFSTNFDSDSGKETLLPPMYNTWIIFHFWGVE